MKKLIVKNRYYLLVILCLFIGFLPVIVNNKGVLIFNGDDYHQIYQFYLGGIDKIVNNEFSFYDFSIGFGANNFAMAYYLLSPFFIMAIFIGKNLIQYAFLYLTIIKLFLLFVFTYKWSKKVFKSEISCLIGSFTIAFSGWVFSYLHLFVFLDAFILYPLALFFIESYIKENKITGLVITMGMIGIINYYFLYMFIPFSCLYALIRTIETSKNTYKELFLKGARFLGLCILSVGIAAFILIPCGYLLSSNPRFESDINIFSHIGKFDLYKILSGLFAMSIDHESTSIFIDLDKYNFIGWGGGASLYMMVITMMLLPLVFQLKNKLRKYIILSSFLLLAIMVYFKSFWYLLQFNNETRWFYMISFMLAFSAMSVNDELEEGLISKHNILIGLGFYLTFLWLFFLSSYFLKLSSVIDKAFIIVVVLSITAVLISMAYIKDSKKILVLLLAFEAVFSVNQLVLNDKPVNYRITDLALKNQDIVDEIKKDKGFYRVLYNDEYDGFFRYTTSNTPYAGNFKGVSFYSTIYNSEMEDFLSRLKNNWQMDQRYSTWDLYNLLSVKYLYGLSDFKQIPFGYEKIKDGLYLNTNYVELGFTYDKTISRKSFDKHSYLEQDLIMADYLIVENGDDFKVDINLIDYGNMGSDDQRYYAFEKPLNNVSLYLETGTIENVQVDMFYQEKLVYFGYFWQYNYLDFYIDEHTFVDLVVVSGNNENQKYDVGIKVKDMAYYDSWFENRFDEKFYDVKVSKDKIEAKINILDDEKWVFTNIGYDEGWNVLVDGKRVDTYKVQLGFIGFKALKGKHDIVMYYEVPYLKSGIAVSMVSLIVLIIWQKRLKVKL